jgi:exosortase/archaeosortase family protein
MRGAVNKLKVLLALIIIFQGFSIALLSHPILKTSPWLRILGWVMLIGGVWYIYFLYSAAKIERAEKEQEKTAELAQRILIGGRPQMRGKTFKKPVPAEEPEAPVEESLLTRLMKGILKRTEKFSHYTLPIIGALIIDAVIIYNILVQKSLDIKSWDMITILFGVSLILYNFIPENFSFARDFFVFFLGLLFLILVFPPIFYELLFGSGGSANVTDVLLAKPVSGLLNLGGIESYTEIQINLETGNEVAYVFFPLLSDLNGPKAGVGIGEACSGVYTASIFLAAFITFVLIEYKRFDLKVGVIIVLGVFTTYIANILRMTIIVLMGHYYDTDTTNLVNLNWWHINAGWLIFMAWIIPFWWLMYRFLMRKDMSKGEEESTN